MFLSVFTTVFIKSVSICFYLRFVNYKVFELKGLKVKIFHPFITFEILMNLLYYILTFL